MTTLRYPPIPGGRFLALDLSIEAAGLIHQLLEKVPPASRDLADQARGSSASIPLDLSEGLGRTGRDRLQYWRIAHASSKETTTSIQLLHAMNAVDPPHASQHLALLDRVDALTYRLVHPRS